ncbi:MAG: molybdenum cofactor guanylyltransferase [Bdellovibrionaceae bacterium]|nr:molybdenum cofactor guanylyltransferase [Pseudobdellovibrionaceae bacterium]
MNYVSMEGRLSITAVILAGGRSRRMGTSKALLSIGGLRMIERTRQVLHELKPFVQRVVVSGEVPGVEFIPDLKPFQGPVGGVASTARECLSDSCEGLLVVPVDLPLLTADSLRPLVTYFNGHKPNAVCFEGNWLPAIFRLNEDLIFRCGQNESIHGLLKSLGFVTMAPPSDVRSLANANTPHDWAELTRSHS